MSQQLREFVKQSGVEVRPGNSPSSVSTTASNNAKISKLNPGMFNATVNRNFSAETRINLKKILLKTPLPKTPIGEGLYLDTKEINGIYGRFATGFSHTREYGKKGDIGKDFFTVQMKVTISDDTEAKGATINFYKNGKIRFSGGFIGSNISNQPELIRRFIVNSYSDKEAFLYTPFEYNNLSGQFRVNGIFKSMDMLAQRLATRYGAMDVKYDPELSPFMYVTYKGHKYILAKSGNIQISGAPSPADMLSAYTDGSQLAKMLYEGGEITLTASVPNRLVRGKPTRKKAVLTKKQTAALKIDAKQCMRMPKSELVDLAKKMGVVGITTSTKKGEICEKIKKISGVKSATFRNTQKNKNVALVGSGNNFKVGRATCKGYSKTELLRVAGILKIKLDPKETKTTLCKKIENARNAMLAPKPKPKPKTPPTRKEVAQKKKNAVIKKRGLNENSIRKDIVKLYGKRWMTRYKNVMPSLDKDVREMKARLNKLSTGNKQGVPFKKDVDTLKKRLVNRWKGERGRNLEKKVVRNQLNVTGVPNKLVTQYRDAATNYIMKNGPTMKQLEKYKKTWINLRNKSQR
jgi:hypothetical protein